MTTILRWISCGNKPICGTYSREEAEKKVADVLAFAAKHKHPLKCSLE
jgi:ATP-dependent Clp protease adapter protein ClpS